MSFYTFNELKNLGFKSVGKNTKISQKAVFYGIDCISIGDNSRIDDFCVLSAGTGGILIEEYVHLGIMCTIIGKGKVSIGKYSTLSGKTSIYSSSDDYSGGYMTNPTIPEEFTKVEHKAVNIGKHVIVGSGTVILPGSILEDGVAIAAMSLVKSRMSKFTICAGVPAVFIRKRKCNLLDIEKRFSQRD